MSIIERIVESLLGDGGEKDKVPPVVLYRRNGIYMKAVPSKGRGLFCHEDIKAGELIEIAPVLILSENETSCIIPTILRDYAFNPKGLPIPPAMAAELNIQDFDKASCLLMGVGSFCNHLVHPNAARENAGDSDTPMYRLKAIQDIPAGTEITINYGIAWPAKHRKSF